MCKFGKFRNSSRCLSAAGKHRLYKDTGLRQATRAEQALQPAGRNWCPSFRDRPHPLSTPGTRTFTGSSAKTPGLLSKELFLTPSANISHSNPCNLGYSQLPKQTQRCSQYKLKLAKSDCKTPNEWRCWWLRLRHQAKHQSGFLNIEKWFKVDALSSTTKTWALIKLLRWGFCHLNRF